MINFLKSLYELIFKSKIKRGDNLVSTWQFMLFSWLLIEVVIRLLSAVVSYFIMVF